MMRILLQFTNYMKTGCKGIIRRCYTYSVIAWGYIAYTQFGCKRIHAPRREFNAQSYIRTRVVLGFGGSRVWRLLGLAILRPKNKRV